MSDVSPDRMVQPWTRLASLGLLLAAGGSLVLVVATLAFGVQTEGSQFFFLGFTMIPLIGALLVNRPQWWWKAVGIFTGFLTALGLFWTAFSVTRIASFFDFVPAVLVLPGAVVGIGASTAALRRREDRIVPGSTSEQTWIRVMLGVAAASVLLSSVATVVAKRSADPSKANAAVRLADFEFDRASYDLLGGSTVYVRNDDPFFHTFTVDELGVDAGLGPGSATLVQLPPKPGSYLLYCRPHTSKDDPVDKGMAARLRVL